MDYKITDPKGVLVDGERYKQGKRLPANTPTSQVRAFLRFKQVEELKPSKEPAPQPSKEPSTVDELKAALTELGVKFPEGAKKADLEKLYAESTAPKE